MKRGDDILYYATVEEAFEDANNAGNTSTNILITLLADAAAGETLTVKNQRLITLDCGGHTLTSSQQYTISLSYGSGLTLQNGKVENTCPSGCAIFSDHAQRLRVENTAVLEAIGSDGIGLAVPYFDSEAIQISGKVKGRIYGILAFNGNLKLVVNSGAVIAGGLYGIYIAGAPSVITLNGGAIIGVSKSKNAIEIDGSHQITVNEGMTATLNDTELAGPITSSTGAGTLVICADHRPGKWTADGTRTCPNCPFKQQAAAKFEKDGRPSP